MPDSSAAVPVADPAGIHNFALAWGSKARSPAKELGFVLRQRCLAMTYSRMRMHTTIGAGAFHFRVRDGIGWDHTAMVAKH